MEEKDIVQDLRDRLIRIETLLEQQTINENLKNEKLKLEIDMLNNRIEKLESQSTWQNRAIAGGIISCAIAFLFK